MATENPRPEKVAAVAEVRERLSSAEAALLTEYRGLDVSAMAELRRAIGEAGGDYKIYKNTLVRFAATELELDIGELLVGPTAIAFVGSRADGSSGDAASLAKALRDFAKDNNNLVIKGGILDAERLSLDEITALADLPPRPQLLAEFAGAMESMYQDFAGLLDAKLREFGYALQEAFDKQGGAEAADSAEAEATGGADAPADEEATAAAPADADTDEAAAPAETETDEVAAPAETETDEVAAPTETETDEVAAPAETETDEEAAPAEADTAEGGDDKTEATAGGEEAAGVDAETDEASTESGDDNPTADDGESEES